MSAAAPVLVSLALLLALAPPVQADEPLAESPSALSFAFLDEQPGELVSIGATRLHLHCRGRESAATVLFEAGLGGSALEWDPVARALAPHARVCSYDRAGYGWSDPTARGRNALQLAAELDRLLAASGTRGPFVLVAHSFGGFVARLLAERRDDIAALVLLDASHEDQFRRLESAGGRPLTPRTRQFVISMNEPPESLPEPIRRKVAAFGRMRKTYSATHGEMAGFRASAEQVHTARTRRAAPYDFPVTVIRRGIDVYGDRGAAGARRTATWIALQEDLATLGTPSRLVVAERSGHHVHADEPRRVVAEVRRLLERIENRSRGTAPAPGALDTDPGAAR